MAVLKPHNDADKATYVFRADRPEAQEPDESEKAPAKTSAKSTSTSKEK